jgi:hypothetical protein
MGTTSVKDEELGTSWFSWKVYVEEESLIILCMREVR